MSHLNYGDSSKKRLAMKIHFSLLSNQPYASMFFFHKFDDYFALVVAKQKVMSLNRPTSVLDAILS